MLGCKNMPYTTRTHLLSDLFTSERENREENFFLRTIVVYELERKPPRDMPFSSLILHSAMKKNLFFFFQKSVSKWDLEAAFLLLSAACFFLAESPFTLGGGKDRKEGENE